MKIRYKNVGCIRNAEVEYKPGQLVAIIGESNQGKSLQFYSLLSGFMNSSDFKKFINIDALAENPKAKETISLTDDTGVNWEVNASVSSMNYRIGNVKYDKTHRKNIFELSESQIPGLLYDPDNCTPIMNIVDEDAGMFPIDRSDSQIFKTYERLLRLSCTEDILRTIKLDLEDIDYQISDKTKAMQKDQVKLQKILDFLKNTDDSELDFIIGELEQFNNAKNSLAESIEKADTILSYVNMVGELSYMQNDFDIKRFQSLLQLLSSVLKTETYCKKASNIDLCNETLDIESIKNVFELTSKAVYLIKEIEDLTNAIDKDNLKLKEINSELDSIEICPLCGKPM